MQWIIEWCTQYRKEHKNDCGSHKKRPLERARSCLTDDWWIQVIRKLLEKSTENNEKLQWLYRTSALFSGLTHMQYLALSRLVYIITIIRVFSTRNPTSLNHLHRPQLCSGTILGICRLFSWILPFQW